MTKLRCWRGCIAQITHLTADIPLAERQRLIGVTRRLTNLVYNKRGREPSWEYEGERIQFLIGDVADCLPDAFLTPITSPPGTVIDDESTDLKQPKPEGVSA